VWRAMLQADVERAHDEGFEIGLDSAHYHATRQREAAAAGSVLADMS
jgi:hypothetical protein